MRGYMNDPGHVRPTGHVSGQNTRLDYDLGEAVVVHQDRRRPDKSSIQLANLLSSLLSSHVQQISASHRLHQQPYLVYLVMQVCSSAILRP